MEETTETGGEALETTGSETSVLDEISSHMGDSTNETEIQLNETTTQEEPPVEETNEQTTPEATPQAEENEPEQLGRAEERISELSQKVSEAEHRVQVLEQFIMANPTARQAWEQSFGQQGQGQVPHQAQAQQGYDMQQLYEHHYDQPPEWDFTNPDNVVDFMGHQFQQQAAPFVHRLHQLEQVLTGMVQGQQQQHQTHIVSELDRTVFEAIPSTKDNKEHFHTVSGFVAAEMNELSPQDRRDAQKVTEAAKRAAERAKKVINGGGQPNPNPKPAPKPQNLHVESGGNMVSPKPAEPKSVDEQIMAHLNSGKA